MSPCGPFSRNGRPPISIATRDATSRELDAHGRTLPAVSTAEHALELPASSAPRRRRSSRYPQASVLRELRSSALITREASRPGAPATPAGRRACAGKVAHREDDWNRDPARPATDLMASLSVRGRVRHPEIVFELVRSAAAGAERRPVLAVAHTAPCLRPPPRGTLVFLLLPHQHGSLRPTRGLKRARPVALALWWWRWPSWRRRLPCSTGPATAAALANVSASAWLSIVCVGASGARSMTCRAAAGWSCTRKNRCTNSFAHLGHHRLEQPERFPSCTDERVLLAVRAQADAAL